MQRFRCSRNTTFGQWIRDLLRWVNGYNEILHSFGEKEFRHRFLFVLTFDIDDTKAHEPRYTDGRIYFNLTGGVCNQSQKYRLVVVLICDYSSQVQELLQMMPYVSSINGLNSLFNWYNHMVFFSFSINRRTTNVNLLFCCVHQKHAIHYQRQSIQTLAKRKTQKQITFSIWCHWVHSIIRT